MPSLRHLRGPLVLADALQHVRLVDGRVQQRRAARRARPASARASPNSSQGAASSRPSFASIMASSHSALTWIAASPACRARDSASAAAIRRLRAVRLTRYLASLTSTRARAASVHAGRHQVQRGLQVRERRSIRPLCLPSMARVSSSRAARTGSAAGSISFSAAEANAMPRSFSSASSRRGGGLLQHDQVAGADPLLRRPAPCPTARGPGPAG